MAVMNSNTPPTTSVGRLSRQSGPLQWQGLVPLAALLALWWLAGERNWIDETVFAPIDYLFAAAVDPIVGKNMLAGLAATFWRLLQGCVIGVSIGLVLGAGMGLSHSMQRIVGPSFHALRQVAVIAWVPLLTAWFGAGDACKIIFVAIASSKPAVMGAYEGVRNVPASLVEAGQSLRFSRVSMLRHVILPGALPSIMNGIQLSLIYGWFAAIGAEYVIGVLSGGIGAVVIGAQEHFRSDLVLLGVTLIALTGIALNKILRVLVGKILAKRG